MFSVDGCCELIPLPRWVDLTRRASMEDNRDEWVNGGWVAHSIKDQAKLDKKSALIVAKLSVEYPSDGDRPLWPMPST